MWFGAQVQEVPRRLTGRHPTVTDRAHAVDLDRHDPLAAFTECFDVPDGDPPLVYFCGNSLGLQPRATEAVVLAELERWRSRLIRGWNERWLDLVAEASTHVAELIGAPSAGVRVADSTTVCLSNLANAGLRVMPTRPDVLSDRGNFPTDLYVLDAAARAAGGRLRLLDGDPAPRDVAAALDARVGLVALSHVDFRTGARLDLPAITARTREAGALSLWDLSHSAGVMPVNVTLNDVDLAVGCTYKYLHGGPGAPAYVYVRPDLADQLQTPIPGWFGHAAPFAMEASYRPAPGVDRFRAGTPAMLSVAAMMAGLEMVRAAGVSAVRAKSVALTALAIALSDAWLADHGVEVVTPRDPARRGGQIALRHPEARRIVALLAHEQQVIGDFREPDIVRLGLAPLGLRFVDVYDGFRRFASGLERGDLERYRGELGYVT